MIGLLGTTHSREEQEEYSWAIKSHLSLWSKTVASNRARSGSLVERQYVFIAVSFVYRRKVGGAKSRLDYVRDEELPAEASNWFW